MAPSLIWIKNIVILIASVILLIYGINIMTGAFKLQNPFEFVMSFFSASLLILVCLTGIIYCYFRFFPKNYQNETDNETK
jgi:membrane protein YdbS with pleckstrin-like domain